MLPMDRFSEEAVGWSADASETTTEGGSVASPQNAAMASAFNAVKRRNSAHAACQTPETPWDPVFINKA